MLDRFLDELEKLGTQYYGQHGEWSYTFNVEDDGVEVRLFIPYKEKEESDA